LLPWIGYQEQAGLCANVDAPAGPPLRSQTMSYIDGFVIAVPTANKQQFIEHARHFDALFT